jgi:CBS domain-containing protein
VRADCARTTVAHVPGMKVEQLMQRDVVTVSPGTTLKAVARLLVERRISGLPVVDDSGEVLGVVSAGDIVAKEQGAGPMKAHRLRWLFRGDERAPAKRELRDAGDAMSTPAITVGPLRSVADAARLMTEHGIKRLPVVSGGKLIGIVTRSDLVRAFTRTDAELEQEIRDDVLLGSLWIDPTRVQLIVSNGEVKLEGRLETRTQAEILAAYVARVPGIVSVDDSLLSWAADDLARRPEDPTVYWPAG